MIKGCSKRMIVLKNTGSELFDEAYFVVKPHSSVSSFKGERAFIDEANRILNESLYATSAMHKSTKSTRSSFFSGAFIGFLIGGVCTAAFILCIV